MILIIIITSKYKHNQIKMSCENLTPAIIEVNVK
jgi:hypothetical protein